MIHYNENFSFKMLSHILSHVTFLQLFRDKEAAESHIPCHVTWTDSRVISLCGFLAAWSEMAAVLVWIQERGVYEHLEHGVTCSQGQNRLHRFFRLNRITFGSLSRLWKYEPLNRGQWVCSTCISSDMIPSNLIAVMTGIPPHTHTHTDLCPLVDLAIVSAIPKSIKASLEINRAISYKLSWTHQDFTLSLSVPASKKPCLLNP